MRIDIYADIACPWCYVGKRRLEAALAAFEHRESVRMRWRSFELDPSAPPEREGDHATLLARKYGMSVEQAHAAHAQMAEMAAAEGLEFRFDLVRAGNTFDAHRLTHLAAAHGRQDAMEERLMRAYLTEGALLSDHATLRALAADVGLPDDEVADALATGNYADAVRADQDLARAFGISAVPFFAANRAIGATGAQPAETMLAFLREAWTRGAQGMASVATGEACGPDGC